MSYIADVFNPINLEHGKSICLTPDPRVPLKWDKETIFLLNFLLEMGIINNNTTVADFGCGVGRVSKSIISRLGCPVFGFDISESMLSIASQYVFSKLFTSVLYNKEYNLSEYRETFDVVLSVFVLQHSQHPVEDIQFIHSIMKNEATFILINEKKRFIPSDISKSGQIIWEDDGINIENEVMKYFKLVGRYSYINRYDDPITIWKRK